MKFIRVMSVARKKHYEVVNDLGFSIVPIMWFVKLGIIAFIPLLLLAFGGVATLVLGVPLFFVFLFGMLRFFPHLGEAGGQEQLMLDGAELSDEELESWRMITGDKSAYVTQMSFEEFTGTQLTFEDFIEETKSDD